MATEFRPTERFVWHKPSLTLRACGHSEPTGPASPNQVPGNCPSRICAANVSDTDMHSVVSLAAWTAIPPEALTE